MLDTRSVASGLLFMTTVARPNDDVLRGPAILDAFKDSGIQTIVSVPDIVTSEGLLRLVRVDEDIHHVSLCKEDEGISICTALSYCGKRSLLMMQQTGMYDSVNAIRAIAVDYGHPVCMLIGLQGAQAEVAPRDSDKHIVRVAEPVLDALGVEHHLLSYASDVDKIKPAIEKAYATSRPVALLVGAMLPPA